jgi:signal transduction histidine kinase
LPTRSRSSPAALLRRIADEVLESADLEGVAALLVRGVPSAVGAAGATLLLWDRKLEAFEALSPHETRRRPIQTGEGVPAPQARYLVSGGQAVDTGAQGAEGALVPLLARSGLVGMLVLGPRSRRRGYRAAEARALGLVAARAALALENQLYHAELVASERLAAVGTMAGMLAHDFRGPMTVIRGYAETLIEPGVGPEEVRDRADLIIRMVDRLERMTSETLDFVRGARHLARRPVELAGFVQDLAAEIERAEPALALERSLDIPSGVRAVLDVDKLHRAVLNIAANAREAMGGRGCLHFEARLEAAAGGPQLGLVLADEGPGVPEAIRNRLFDPFVTAGKKGGTGLGLAVARRFVEDHGGRLELMAEGPGAHFRITLPISNAARDDSSA